MLNINETIMEHLSMLCSNDLLKHLFLSNLFITTCKRNKDLEETLGPENILIIKPKSYH